MEIVDIKFQHPSFSWCDGRYIIVKIHDDIYDICKIDDGMPQLFDDGRFMVSCTSIKNPGITKTNLIYDTKRKKVVENPKYIRLEKLNKIKEKYGR